MKHVKKYNTGIIYECLLREISATYVDKRQLQLDVVFNILERYFLGKKAPLKREVSFFTLLEDCETLNEAQARQVLNELENFAKNTDIKKLNETKAKLIEEINIVLGENVLNHKLSNYKILASTEQLLEHYRDIKSFKDSIEKVRIENEIVNFLTSDRKINESVLPVDAIDEGIDDFVLGVVMNEFKKKYNNLSAEQMDIIKESITTKDINKVQKMEQDKMNLIKESAKQIGDQKLLSEVKKIIEDYKPIEDFSNESLMKTLSYFELAKSI